MFWSERKKKVSILDSSTENKKLRDQILGKGGGKGGGDETLERGNPKIIPDVDRIVRVYALKSNLLACYKYLNCLII